MPDKEIKPAKSSPEETVAKINFKQAIIVALITATLTAVTAIIVAEINKPDSPADADAEGQYFEKAAQVTDEELEEDNKDLEDAQEDVQKILDQETDPEKVRSLKKIKEMIAEARKTNERIRESVKKGEHDAIESSKKGNRIGALILRGKVNDKLDEEYEEKQKVVNELRRNNLPVSDRMERHHSRRMMRRDHKKNH